MADNALQSTLRARSINAKVQQVNTFPLDAFEFDGPKSGEDRVLRMKPGWRLYVDKITLAQLDFDVTDLDLEVGYDQLENGLESELITAILRSKDNELWIINNAGAINLNADEIELRVKAADQNGNQVRDAVIQMYVDDAGSVIKVDANNIYLGDKDGNPETLDGVITIVNDEVRINGNLLVVDPAEVLETIEISNGEIKFTDSSGFGGTVSHTLSSTGTNLNISKLQINRLLNSVTNEGGHEQGQIGFNLGSSYIAWGQVSAKRVHSPPAGRSAAWQCVYRDPVGSPVVYKDDWYKGYGIYTIRVYNKSNGYYSSHLLCVAGLNDTTVASESNNIIIVCDSQETLTVSGNSGNIRGIYYSRADTMSSVQGDWEYPGEV